MSAVYIERLRSSQIPAVQELIYATAYTSASFSYLLRYCLFAKASAFVAKTDKRIVGFIGGSETDAVAMIECLCVDHSHRNLGIATSLIDIFLKGVSAATQCKLDVRLSNTLARQFYIRRGFKEVSTKALFYQDEDGLTMQRPAGYVPAAQAIVP